LSFLNVVEHYRDFDFEKFLKNITGAHIDSILEKERITELEFLSLLSPPALDRLEQMAQKAQKITQRQFGNCIVIFTPLYISNECENNCPYCSFASQHRIERRHLSFREIEGEALRISETGIRHILLLTGESHTKSSVDYLLESVRLLGKHFPSIGIETYPLHEKDYRRLIEAGVDGLTIFQETYNESVYHAFHKGEPKDDFDFRVKAPERAGRQGMRTISIGALMGLGPTLHDAFFTGIHAHYLQKNFPGSEISISFPRLRPLAATFSPPYTVTDTLFVQVILATRIFLPRAGITISTRESASMRNALLPLGVTKMSAGVSTAVGAHTSSPSTTQFEIADTRTVARLKEELISLGYQTVMQDWNSNF
jgi:2-iminoacetate synthase